MKARSVLHCTSSHCSCRAKQRERDARLRLRLRLRRKAKQLRLKAKLRSPKPMPRCCAINVESGKRCPFVLKSKREIVSGLCDCHGLVVYFMGSFATQSDITFLSWAKWNDTRELWKVRAAEHRRLARINDILTRARALNADVARAAVERAIMRADHFDDPAALNALIGEQS